MWGERSAAALAAALADGPLVVNQLIYAEVSVWFPDPRDVDAALSGIPTNRLDLPWEAAYRAGQAFLAYRRAGGARRSPLPDFYIGAHAEFSGLRLLTRDTARYATYFPDVELLIP